MDFFIEILNLSLVSSYVIVFVLIARLLLKKAPKLYSYMLWAVVFIRLTCSFTFELPIGLIPESQPIQAEVVYKPQSNITVDINQVIDFNQNITPIIPSEPATVPTTTSFIEIALYIWLIGIALMLGYNLYSYVKLKRNLVGSMLFKDNIYISDYITSPFVIDVIKPKIYLPSDIKASEIDFIIAHEKTHIKRLDHITRVVAFFVLSLHWFNPLVWCAYFLSGRDMELSCDEEVIKQTNSDIRKEYSQSLLNFAVGRVITTPAFGVNITIDTKERIQNIMKFKKPVMWVSALAITSVTVLSIGCMATTSADNLSFVGVGEVGKNDIQKAILQTFSTSTSSSNSTNLINDASQNKLFANYYGEVALTQEGSNFYFPDIYISPSNMAIFTLNNQGLPLAQDTDIDISFNLANDESLTLETGVIFDGDCTMFNEVKGIDFFENYNTNYSGEHYLYIINRTSENAIIQNGLIKVNGEMINQDNFNSIEDELNKIAINKNDIIFSGLNTSRFFSGSGDEFDHYNLVFENIKFSIAGNDVGLGEQNIATINIDEEGNNLLVALDIETDSKKSKISYEFNIDKIDNSFNLIKNNTTSDFDDIITTDVITLLALEIYDYANTKDNDITAVINTPVIINMSESRVSVTFDYIDISFTNYDEPLYKTNNSENIRLDDIRLFIAGEEVYLGEQNEGRVGCYFGEDGTNMYSIAINTDINLPSDYDPSQGIVTGEAIALSFTLDETGFNITFNETSNYFDDIISTDDIVKLALEIYDYATAKDSRLYQLPEKPTVDERNPIFTFENDGVIVTAQNNSELFQQHDNITTIALVDIGLSIAGEDIYLSDQKTASVSCHDNGDSKDYFFKLSTHINRTENYYPAEGNFAGEYMVHNFTVDNEGITVTQSLISDYFLDVIDIDVIENICLNLYEYAKTQ